MWVGFSIIFLMLVLAVVMSFSATQTFVAKKAVNWVNDKYETDIELEGFQYIFPDQFVLKEVFIADERDDTLAYASELSLHFNGFNSLTNTAHSRGVEANNLKFYWTKAQGDTAYGFEKFVGKFSSGDTTSAEPFGLEVSDMSIENGRFWYEDKGCDDCFKMLLQDMQVEASDFDMEGSFFSLDVENLSLKDKYSLTINSMSTFYEMQEDHMAIEGLKFETARSNFDGDILFEYDSMEDFSDFVNKVRMEAIIRESTLQSEEIQVFGEAFPDFRTFSLSGSAEGTINDLKAENIDLKVGSTTELKGSLALKNTTYTDSLFIDASQIDFHTIPKDVRFMYALFSDTALPIEVEPLGAVSLHGDFKGYLDDFITEARINTELGNVRADLKLKNPGNENSITYNGDIELDNFDIGTLLNDSTLGKISTNMSVDGRGTDPTSMDTRLEGNVSALQLMDYNYKDITINGRIKRSKFDGELAINDPNLNFRFNGSASFGQDTSTYNFNANVQHANLTELKLVSDSIAVITAEMDIDLIALDYEKWAGDVRLFNTTYENGRHFYFFQDITVHTEGLDTNRYMEVRSNIVDANLSGDYTFGGIQKAFTSQISKFVKSTEPVNPPADENFIFDITIKNTQLLTELFLPELRVEPQSKLVGTYSSKQGELDVEVSSPGFSWNYNLIENLSLEYKGGVERSQLGFDVASLQFKNGIQIDSLSLGNYYYNDTLFYDLGGILKDSINSNVHLLGYALQTDSSAFEIGVFKSGFNIGLQQFTIQDENKIILDSSGIHIEDLVISNEGRELFVNGNISDNPNEILRLNLRGFGMDVTNYFIGSDAARFNGNLYGDVILTELLGSPKFAADLHIDSLEMNKTLLGDFSVTSDWTVKNDTIHLSSEMNIGDLQTFKASGYYQPDSLGSMMFDVSFDRFRLAAFNPFLAGIAENARGYVSGGVKIRGNTGKPIVTGELTLPNTAFTVSLLKADYNVEGVPTIKIEEDKILLPDLTLRDTKYGTRGVVSGGITHDNFSDFVLDFNIKADELLVLNTDAKTNDPYYGTAFVSGDVSIKGPVDEIAIQADVTSERDTEFFLPIDGATEVSKTSFVTFIEDPAEEDSTAQGPRSINLNKGVSLDFKLRVNNNARVNIIVDSDAGNELNATGYGNLRLKMSPYQDIEMYGTYTVSDGTYNFVMPGLKRKFEVLRGGTVTWNGDPYTAIIGLTARYTTKADPAALVNIYQGGRTMVQLDLFLSGELFDPEIDFDINAPRADGTVQSVLNNQLSDRDKMYRQVFSLLALNSFAPAEGFEGGGTSGTDVALSALATQATGYLNQVTGDYEFSLGYQGANQNQSALNQQREEVEVGVSKSFFDDRVTVNGTVGVAVGDNETQSNQRQVAGDFEVEYNITDDGRFRAKVFNRSLDDYDQYSLGQQNYEQGVGVYYRMDFETWEDFVQRILHPNKKEAVRPKEDEQFMDENEKGL